MRTVLGNEAPRIPVKTEDDRPHMGEPWEGVGSLEEPKEAVYVAASCGGVLGQTCGCPPSGKTNKFYST